MNVDLCFVPWEHAVQVRLPAVSGSSGHLVVEREAKDREAAQWPGQVFQQEDLSYEEAQRYYAQHTRDRLTRQTIGPRPLEAEPTAWRADWEARAERHPVVQQRRQEDAEWLSERKSHHQLVEAYRALNRRRRAEQVKEWQAHKQHWASREQVRQTVMDRRKAENQTWHQHNRERHHTQLRVWIAVLVITDNCTRQCLGLPVFASGAKLTAHEVTSALRTLLPPHLAFLISDQGVHFRSKALASLAEETDFVHIPIYRHRPQTNGIAERFVRTLKYELRHLQWSGPDELSLLLATFLPIYNDRPHQGLAIPGLSPNEFAKRIFLM